MTSPSGPPPQSRARSGSKGSTPSGKRRGRSKGRHTRPSATTYRRRRILLGAASLGLIFVAWLGISLGIALTNQSYGVSYSARFAEWGRDHHMGGLVTWLEKEYNALNPPKKGGKPAKGEINAKAKAVSALPASCKYATEPPKTVVSPAGPNLLGEGIWVGAGRLTAGCPGVWTTTVRPDAVHTSYVAGLAWMDPKLVSFTLYSGSQIPGGGPYSNTAPIKPTAAETLISAFNAGFRIQDAQGGYYTDNKTVSPLRLGAASSVIYRDGTMNIGAWGTDVSMTPQVVSVRQNLDLIVANEKPAAGLTAADNARWGATLGGAATVWRSGMGVTADGAIVYAGGPALTITALADLLIRAGSVRAMELDINTDWVQYSIFSPLVGQPATPANGKPLLSNMAGGGSGPARYFASWWTRDFFTSSARFAATAAMPAPKATTTTTTTKKK